MQVEIKNFIGGEFCATQGKNSFMKTSPYTGEVIAEVALSDAFDFIVSLQAAKKAQPLFEALNLEQRAEFLQKLADVLETRSDEIALLEASHQGLSKSFILLNSIHPSIDYLRLIAEDLKKNSTRDDLKATGIVGVITPWCLSLKLILERIAPALAAGNTVIVKVSEQSPITTKILGEAFQEIQLPAGVVNLLNGKADIAAILAGHPGVRAITAAGSQPMMESVAKAGLSQFKKIQLSGAAKNNAMVLADTDFQSLMPKILRPFLVGQAQMCWNVSRIFVVESMLKDFQMVLEDYLANLRPAQSPEDDSPWGPLISRETMIEMSSSIRLAQSEHGKILSGGEPLEGKGYFHKPTVMVDVTNCSALQQDEVHGPLLLLTAVKYQHEMAKWANTSYLAQGAVIWGSPEKAQKLMSKLECGQVWVNTWMNGSEKPLFGHKQSSFGNLEMAWDSSFYSDVKNLTGV